MYPALKPGDEVIVDSRAPLEVGSVVCIKAFNDRKPLIHRIIYISPSFYITRGDNSFIPDSPVTFKNVQGVVRLRSKEGLIAKPSASLLENTVKYVIFKIFLFYYCLRFLIKKYVVKIHQ